MLHLPDAVCVLVLCLTLDYSLHFTKIKDIGLWYSKYGFYCYWPLEAVMFLK